MSLIFKFPLMIAIISYIYFFLTKIDLANFVSFVNDREQHLSIIISILFSCKYGLTIVQRQRNMCSITKYLQSGVIPLIHDLSAVLIA